MREWHEIKSAPGGEVVETKIDDENGSRNHALLRRSGNLWFVPNGSMYVYYKPTHWRHPTPEQLESFAREAETEAKLLTARAAEYRRVISSHMHGEPK